MTNPDSRVEASPRPAPGQGDAALDPFEIDFRPEFRENRGPREPFINSQGVVIGDHDYESGNSPLEQWSEETDPAVMAGDEWVHPYKDIGFRTQENRELFEEGIPPRTGSFMHPTHQTADLSRIADSPLDLDEEYESYYPIPEVLDEP